MGWLVDVGWIGLLHGLKVVVCCCCCCCKLSLKPEAGLCSVYPLSSEPCQYDCHLHSTCRMLSRASWSAAAFAPSKATKPQSGAAVHHGPKSERIRTQRCKNCCTGQEICTSRLTTCCANHEILNSEDTNDAKLSALFKINLSSFCRLRLIQIADRRLLILFLLNLIEAFS